MFIDGERSHFSDDQSSGAESWAPREVHVDLSQEFISDWTYEKFHEVPPTP